MKADMKHIEELMKILQEKKLTELLYESDEMKLTLKCSHQEESMGSNEIELEPKDTMIVEKDNPQFQYIFSEHIGIYTHFKKGNLPVIKVGQQIKVGEKIGNITAVGVSSVIESKYAGVIEEIYVTDGVAVDYGKKLIKVKIF